MGFGDRGAAIPSTRDRGIAVKVLPFVPPWLMIGLLLGGAALTHAQWGTTAALPWATGGLTLATAGLTILTYTVTRENIPSKRIHTTTTVSAGLVWLTIATITGPLAPIVWDIWLIGGPVLALSWNIRRLIIAGKGEKGEKGDGGESELFKKVKLAGSKVAEIEAKPNRVQAKLQLPSGELTSEDATKAAGRIASAMSVPKNGVRVTPDPEHHDRATMTIVPNDLLKSGIEWAGPSAFGGSIMDQIQVGMYEDGLPAGFWLPGDVSAVRNATHGLVMGMNGAGKSAGGQIAWGEILTRTDVALWLGDPVKGKQTLGAFVGRADWVATTQNDAQAMVDCLMDVITARADKLGEYGYEQWTPEAFAELKMPFLVVWIEEASKLLRDDEQAIDLVQQGRSAGVSLMFSLQRPSYRNMTTDVRQQLGLTWCFGVKGIEDAAFALSDDVIDQGVDPSLWQNKKPGYSYLVAPGVDDERQVVPLRTFKTDTDALLEAIDAAADLRAPLDAVTAKAAGKAYAKRNTEIADQKTTAVEAVVDDEGDSATEDTVTDLRTYDPFKDRSLLNSADEALEDLLSADPEPDLECDDPDAELPQLPEMTFPDRKPTVDEARELLRTILANLRQSGTQTVGPKDVPAEFLENVRSRPWVSAELGRMANNGELIETNKTGVYRFPPEADLGHAA